ncbi:hypothetical protein Pla52o_35020 [Novipirellula galeiformis]|uniref:Uncharacterized protein n=1 Tax=Novipirellula galeiformis TaxID=2528004 RepID=A0A5C6CGT0_9BACT|nr:hypothetical protein [Novipirellula galeiformis]TWU22446.1 hypothetical protein Pla52o_35020 [Novipirellula galeiformis]
MQYTKITIDSQPVIDADLVIDQLASYPDWADGINSLDCEIGIKPSMGRFLLTAQHAALVSRIGVFNIVWTNGEAGGGASKTVTLKNYCLVESFAAAEIPESPVVMIVADARYLHQKTTTHRRFNCRSAAGQFYNHGTSTLKTAAEILSELKSDLTGTGIESLAYPVASGTPVPPENLYCDGGSTLEAIDYLAAHTGHTIAFDPYLGDLILVKIETAVSVQMAGLLSLSDTSITNDLLHEVPAFPRDARSLEIRFRQYHSYDRSFIPLPPLSIERTGNASARVGSKVAIYGSRFSNTTTLDPDEAYPCNSDDIGDEADRLAELYLTIVAINNSQHYKHLVGLVEFPVEMPVGKIRWLVSRNSTVTRYVTGIQVPEPLQSFARVPERPKSTDVVEAANESGGARERGDVMSLCDRESLTSCSMIAAETPSVGNANPWFGVVRFDVSSNERTELQMTGECVAKVNIGNVSHRRARINYSSVVLESSHVGPVSIVRAPAETGESKCLVSLGPDVTTLVTFLLLDDLDLGSAAAKLETMSGDEIEVDSVLDPLGMFDSLTTGDTGLALFQGGKYYVIHADKDSSSSSSSYSESESYSESISDSHVDSHSESDSHIDSESDKSTAIVPASWTHGGYTALFTLEAPEVRFDDVMTIKTRETDFTVAVDPHFFEVCEKGTIAVCGAVADVPVVVGASVDKDTIRVRLSDHDFGEAVITLRLTAVRRGFAGKRFPNRTREQFEHNENFLRSAYPGAGQ